jgi:hypothetical protein
MVDRSSPRNSHIRPLVRAPKMSDRSDSMDRSRIELVRDRQQTIGSNCREIGLVLSGGRTLAADACYLSFC